MGSGTESNLVSGGLALTLCRGGTSNQIAGLREQLDCRTACDGAKKAVPCGCRCWTVCNQAIGLQNHVQSCSTFDLLGFVEMGLIMKT